MKNESNKESKVYKKLPLGAGWPEKSKLEILMEILCEKKILTEEERQEILNMY